MALSRCVVLRCGLIVMFKLRGSESQKMREGWKSASPTWNTQIFLLWSHHVLLHTTVSKKGSVSDFRVRKPLQDP